MNGIYKDDPAATYRGYRRQALYCLHRVFDDGLTDDTVIQPEGNEDLEIQDSFGKRIEVVQVKDYSANLTASDFKPSFYRRIIGLCKSDPSVKIKIVSFGTIGPELLKAYDNNHDIPNRPLSTLMKDREETDKYGNKQTIKGLSEEEAKEVFTRIETEVVDEATLTERVLGKLRATMTSGNPKVAFENLMWWLISSAEKKRRLTRSQTIEKLMELGKFIANRNAHAQEWNVSIKPIESATPDAQTREKLSQEFFQGGRVRVEHIAAGLDVPRDRAIAAIHDAFQRKDVVILRGASGQGKTTLAYRYLLDWAPSDFRYQVEKAASLEHARLMAKAIAGHAENIDVPSVIYIDVRPGDNLWVEIVRELADVKGIRVLVTIRAEDWFRSRVSTQDFAFADISMDFAEESANQLFANLRNVGYGDEQLDFKEAWSKLGDRKTLFEFVYLVPQNERLSRRVQAQIGILKDEVNKGELADRELHLLRLVAVASAYEARLDLKALADFIGLPEPTRVLERFGNEYLLRTSADGKQVEGFHAIRSEMIAQELTDAVLQPRGMIEALLPPLVVEDDLENLLLCSFSRSDDTVSEVLKKLYEMQFDTWIGVRAVLVALQWLGIKQYAAKNIHLVEEVRLRWPTGWSFILDWDLAQEKGSDGFGIVQLLSHTNPEAATASTGYRNRQSDKNEVFDFARRWLKSFRLPNDCPDSITQFSAAGEVLYWLGHLGEKNQNLVAWLSDQAIQAAWSALPLHLFARFAAGVFEFDALLYADWAERHRKDIEARIRSDATIVALVEEDDCLVAHFVINIERKASDLHRSDREASVNDLAVQRVEIISACLPGYAKYGAAGYGHQMSLFDSLGDDSTKRMPLDNIKKPWLPEFNALSRGAVEYVFRPNSWDSYFANVRELRKMVVIAFTNLRHVLAKGADTTLLNTSTWDECKKNLSGEFLLPKSAVDEWGFVTESRASQIGEGKRTKFSAISTLEPFNNALNEYTRTLGSFFSQALEALVLAPNLRHAANESVRQAIVEKFKKLGVHENSIRLSVINGMDGCIALRQLKEIEQTLQLEGRLEFDEGFAEKELREFVETMRSWMSFCYPDQVPKNVSKQKSGKRQNNRQRRPKELKDFLRATLNRVSQELKRLKNVGIDAQVISETVKWNGDSALWISFDVDHPLSSLVAIETLWEHLKEAFKPDRQKVARIKAIDWFWNRIVLVPLVQGRSIEKQALPNMKGVANPQYDDLELQSWRANPEKISDGAWDELGLTAWEPQDSWKVFDRFAGAYGTLFLHVDHIADISRCNVNLDKSGEEVLQSYFAMEQDRASPFLQETFDACAAVLDLINDLNNDELAKRPNMVDCMNRIVQMTDAISPKIGHHGKDQLTLDKIVEWRNRMKEALSLLGTARYQWIADSLALQGFTGTDEFAQDS